MKKVLWQVDSRPKLILYRPKFQLIPAHSQLLIDNKNHTYPAQTNFTNKTNLNKITKTSRLRFINLTVICIQTPQFIDYINRNQRVKQIKYSSQKTVLRNLT